MKKFTSLVLFMAAILILAGVFIPRKQQGHQWEGFLEQPEQFRARNTHMEKVNPKYNPTKK